ncbi:hypothetical protein GCM10010329_34710 [Streptomyces spiroverticillatus]|uniref:Nephrocystin 3-like N-terminal domain-containing protein n=1 Tax=Streptomyces finlayi TaxID=67296 RepID=A0A918WX72_9ACTN|nr:hypothetical protein [Streptomyces finlayi]GHA08934.1 hypothetical protein GCM10010329_34710 [Streptomyces spiroverticillatus]GHC91765.1 hypothetical protein GCM10010334_27120 [Streptomyces finlayi]
MSQPSMPVIDFSGYVAERTADFAGRAWVFDEIHRWLADPSGARVFALTGEPGAGKTAVAARLVQMSAGEVPVPGAAAPPAPGAPAPGFLSAVHFCAAGDRHWIDPHTFADSLSHQLKYRYPAFADAVQSALAPTVSIRQHVGDNWGTVVGAEIEQLVVSASPEDRFQRLVREPLEALARTTPGRPVVILVDALDESLHYGGGVSIADLVLRTAALPLTVRFVVTCRPMSTLLHALRRARALVRTLSPGRGHGGEPPDGDTVLRVREDVQEYLESATRREAAVLHRLLSDGLRIPDLVAAVRDRGEGNFLHVRSLLRMLLERRELITPASLAALPDDLDEIYFEFLQRSVGARGKTWRRTHGKVLGVLAVAQSPLTEDRVAAFTGLRLDVVRPVLADLRELLTADDGVQPSRRTYSLFHQSFGEFLLDRDRGAGEYWLDGTHTHRAIARHYWRHRDDWTDCDAYGLDHLAAHLFAAGDFDRLQALVDERWIPIRHTRRNYAYDGLLDDIELAWRAARLADRARAARDGRAPHVGQEVRWALCAASLVRDLPTEAPAALVRAGVWTARQGLAVAGRLPRGEARARTLVSLAPVLPQPARAGAFAAAVESTRQITDAVERARVLAGLLPCLPESLRADVFVQAAKAVRELKDERRIAGGYGQYYASAPGERYVFTGKRATALAALATAMSGMAATGTGSEDMAAVLRELCAEQDEARFTAKAAEIVRTLPLGPPSADSVSHPQDRGGDANELLAVLKVSMAQGDGKEQQATIRQLRQLVGRPVPDMAEELRRRLSGTSPQQLPGELVVLAPELTDDVVPEVLASMRSVKDPDIRRHVLQAMAPHVPNGLLDGFLSAAAERTGGKDPEILAAAAPHLTPPALDRAFEAACSCGSVRGRALAAAALAPHLPEPNAGRARRMAAEAAAGLQGGALSPRAAAVLAPFTGDGPDEARLRFRRISTLPRSPQEQYASHRVTLDVLTLTPSLPPGEREEALRLVGEAVQSAGWLSYAAVWGDAQETTYAALDLIGRLPRSDAARRLSALLASRAIMEASTASYGRNYPGWRTRYRVSLLVRLLPHLRDEQRAQAAEAALSLIVGDLADPLSTELTTTLAWYLPRPLLRTAEEAITERPIPLYLPDDALDEALEVARERRNEDWLFAIALRSQGTGLTTALAVAGDIGGPALQGRLMTECASAFRRLEPPALHAAWAQTLQAVATLQRRDVLDFVRCTGPMAVDLGGEQAVQDAVAAIEDTGQWWP